MMPLMLAGIGEENTIKKIGGSPEIKKHLEDLGFVVGGSVTVVNALGGNVIVNVKESRVAISEEMARRIMSDAEKTQIFAARKFLRFATFCGLQHFAVCKRRCCECE